MSLQILIGLVFAGVVYLIVRSRGETVSMPGGPPPGGWPSVQAAIAAGRKIDAIKLYREQHHVGLREAKEAVEAIARTLPRL
jgi:hypothetical protein